MQDEELMVDVMTNTHSDCMTEADGIITAMESIKDYPSEKVGTDGLLEVSFEVCEDWKKPEQNIDYYIAQASKKVKDPADDKKDVFVFLKSQVIVNDTMAASLEHDTEMEKMGIKAQKEDGTPFTPEEKVALRKKFIQYETGALKVSQTTLTEEAIKNNDVFIEIESAEIEVENKTCFCKDNNFYWSSKINCEERKKVLSVCAELWGEDKKIEKASELMAIMHLETGEKSFKPNADNGVGYSGLIQFNDASAAKLGTTREKLKAMTFIEQMDYVKKYLSEKKALLNTMTDLYLMVLKPNAVGKGNQPDFILFDESISVPNVPYDKDNLNKEPWVTKYGYSSNAPVMREQGEWANKRMFQSYSKGLIERRVFPNGKTYVWEVTDKLTKEHYNIGKNEKFAGRCKNDKNLVLSGRAPWMEIVLQEAKMYGGYSEGGDNVLNKRIKSEYFAIPNEGATSKSDPSEVSWCAAFASWCLQKAGYANPSTCRALEFDSSYVFEGNGNVDKKLSRMRKITNPTYGCIVVWRNTSGGGGHVAFYYGKSANGNIIPLGGNQGSSLQFSSRNPNGDYKQVVVGYFLPEDYPDNPADIFKDEELKLDPVLLNKSGLLAKNGKVSGDT